MSTSPEFMLKPEKLAKSNIHASDGVNVGVNPKSLWQVHLGI